MTLWKVIEGRPASFVEIRTSLLARAGEFADVPSMLKVDTGKTLALIAEADVLNTGNEKRPEFIRRITRLQGRINRTLATAAKTLLEEIETAGASRNNDSFEQVHKKLDFSIALNSKARGNKYMRRLNRPQNDLNAALNSALAILSEYVLNEGRAPHSASNRTPAIEKAIRWHVMEAALLNDKYAGNPRLIRRFRTNQYLVNRCHIVALKLMCELLSQ